MAWCSPQAQVCLGAGCVAMCCVHRWFYGALLHCISLAFCICLIAPFGASAQTRYHYDALGRLILAVSPDGSSTRYTYDATGNITAVTRSAVNALSLRDFTPRGGPVGTTITLLGSGFSTTAADNGVSFNGTAATVSAATATALTVSVPSGATTGKITVTNARGSVTSVNDYVVGDGLPAPTIAGFTPQMGPMGTVVTVTGTNFQTSAEDNKAAIGTFSTQVIDDATTPTATTLKLNVPSPGASGKISVTTPFGEATSVSDFYALPGTVSPSDVAFTGRLAVNGPAVTVTTGTAGKKAVLLFDAKAGQNLRLLTSASTFAGNVIATIYRQDGTNFETLTLRSNSPADFRQTLGADGTYTVVLSPASSDKGILDLRLVADVTGTLEVDGNVAVSLVAGSNAHYRFTAEADRGYGLAVTGLTFTPTGGSLTAYLRKTDGTQLANCTFTASSSCDFNPAVFTAAGDYFLDFDPAGLYAATFNASLVKDAEGTLGVDAEQPALITLAREGQNARYTLSGTAGQLVSLMFSDSTLDDGNPSTRNPTWLSLNKPSNLFNGFVVYNYDYLNTNGSSLVLDAALPETGIYNVWVAPEGLDKGTIKLQVKSYVTGDLALGSRTAVNLSAGRKARYTFQAEAGKGYGLALTGLTFTPAGGSITAYLRKADGTQVTSCTFTSSNSCDLGAENFGTGGTYLLDLRPTGVYAASFDVVLSRDQEGTVNIDGPPVTVTIAGEGENAKYTFSGTAGQLVTLVFSGNTLDDGNTGTTNYTWLALTRPSSPAANPVTYTQLPTGTAGVGLSAALPETGTYTVVLAPVGLDKGTINVQVTSVLMGDLAVDVATAVSLSTGRKARYTFQAEAGKGYGLALTGLAFTPAGGSITAYLRKADGTQVTYCTFTSSNSCDLGAENFTSSGIYMLELSPASAYAANFNAVLSKDGEGVLTVDADPPATVTIAREGQNALHTFSGTAGQLVTLVFSGNTLDDGNAATGNYTWVGLFKPSSPKANSITSTNLYTGTASTTLDVTLPETGTYAVGVYPAGLDKGTIGVQVKSFVTGELTMDGSTPLSLSAGRKARMSFVAEAGKTYGLAITGLAFTPSGGALSAYLRKADGTQLASCGFNGSASCDFGANYFASSGTYYLDFYPSGSYAASFNAVLSKDSEGALTVDADPPATVTIAREGQNALYSFSGTAGQLVTLVFSGNTLDDGNTATGNYTWVGLFKPSSPKANSIASTALYTSTAGTSLDVTLPETGTYMVGVYPAGLDKGTINVQVKSLLTGELALNTSTSVSLSAGRNARYSFQAEAGKGHGLALTGLVFTPTGGSLTASVRKPDGTVFTSCTFSSSSSCDLDSISFTSSGTYKLDLDPSGLYAASFSAVVSKDQDGALTIDAPPVTVTIPGEGQNAKYTFSGTAGQAVTLVFSGNTLDDGNASTTNYTWLALTRPSSPAANPVTYTQLPTGTAGVSLNVTLPETGIYTVVLAPVGLDKGTINVQVKSQ